MTPKLARLEELARKATPGPYHIGHISEIEPGTVDVDGSDGICVCEAYSNNNIEYLCEASPDVILELIGKLRVAREALEFYAKINHMNIIGEFDEGLVRTTRHVGVVETGWRARKALEELERE